MKYKLFLAIEIKGFQFAEYFQTLGEIKPELFKVFTRIDIKINNSFWLFKCTESFDLKFHYRSF